MQSSLSPEDRERITIMAGYGMSLAEMAGIIGIDESLLEDEYKYADLAKLIEIGKARGAFQVKQKAFEMAKSGEHPQMTMFWLKQVEGWEDIKPKEFSKLSVVQGKKGK